MFVEGIARGKEGWGQGCWRGMKIKTVSRPKSIQGDIQEAGREVGRILWWQRENGALAIEMKRLKAQDRREDQNVDTYVKSEEKGKNQKKWERRKGQELEHWSNWSRWKEGEEIV